MDGVVCAESGGFGWVGVARDLIRPIAAQCESTHLSTPSDFCPTLESILTQSLLSHDIGPLYELVGQ
jgi:hypothetical protein